MKDKLYFRVFTTSRSIWRRIMAKWQLYKYHPKQREFVWIGQTGQKIIRVCMEFCNFCKVPIWTISHRKLLNLAGQLFIHKHFSFNVQIFNLINIRNSPQCPHVSAMGYDTNISHVQFLAPPGYTLFPKIGKNKLRTVYKDFYSRTKTTLLIIF